MSHSWYSRGRSRLIHHCTASELWRNIAKGHVWVSAFDPTIVYNCTASGLWRYIAKGHVGHVWVPAFDSTIIVWFHTQFVNVIGVQVPQLGSVLICVAPLHVLWLSWPWSSPYSLGFNRVLLSSLSHLMPDSRQFQIPSCSSAALMPHWQWRWAHPVLFKCVLARGRSWLVPGCAWSRRWKVESARTQGKVSAVATEIGQFFGRRPWTVANF